MRRRLRDWPARRGVRYPCQPMSERRETRLDFFLPLRDSTCDLFFSRFSLLTGPYLNHPKSYRDVCRASNLERQDYKSLDLLVFYELGTIFLWKLNVYIIINW